MDPITLTDALAITARIGTDDPPSSDELGAARKAFAAELRQAKNDFAAFAAALRADDDGDDPVNPLQAVKDFRAAFDACGEALTSVKEEEERLAAAVAESVGDLDADTDDGDADEDTDEGDGDTDPDGDGDEGDGGDTELDLLPLQAAAARLQSRGGGHQPEAPAAPTTRFEIKAGERLQPVETYTMAQLAQDAAESHDRLRAGRHTLAKIRSIRPDPWKLSSTAEANTGILDAVLAPEAIRSGPPAPGAVAAAGGCCFLPETLDQPQLAASTARPIRDSLPSFTSSTGAVQYYDPICLPISSGIDTWSCDDDAAVDPDSPETWKSCAQVDCPDVTEVEVGGIYRCIEIGNFQQRFGANLWQNFLAQAMAQQARIAENRLFALMVTGASTTHPAPETGSVWVNLAQAVAAARADIVQQQRYLGVSFRLWGPEWFYSAVKADLLARRLIEDPSTVTDAQIDGWLQNLGVMFTATPDNGDNFATPQSGDVEVDYPDTANFVLAPEGHFGFLDGGTLDLGTDIRDRDGNRQNVVAAFAESFEGLVVRGCNSKVIQVATQICQDTVCGPTVIGS